MLNERMRTYEFFSFSSLSSLNRRPILSNAWLSEALTLRISVWLPSDVSVLKNEKKLDQSNTVQLVTKLCAQMTGFHREVLFLRLKERFRLNSFFCVFVYISLLSLGT